MTSPDGGDSAAGLIRLTTGVRGLDDVLGGGLFVGGCYLLIGPSGVGKTLLASEMAFRGADQGPALYVTVLSESPARMLAYLSPLDFFDPDLVGERLYYVSGYEALLEGGLDALSDLLFELLRERRPRLFVLDGLANVETLAPSDAAFRRFIHDLGVMTSSLAATGILIDHRDVGQDQAQFAMVDGIIELVDRQVGLRSSRELAVRKLRGSGFLRGSHLFEIDSQGVLVHPRAELLPSIVAPMTTTTAGVHSLGVPEVDRMVGGGLVEGSVTLLAGPSGSGKTLFGLRFLEQGATEGERGLFFGFYETPEHLLRKATGLGMHLDDPVGTGTVHVRWESPLEMIMDGVIRRIVDTVDQQASRRVFIDGLNALAQGAMYPERLPQVFSALAYLLRARGVTCIVTLETLELMGIPESALPRPLAVRGQRDRPAQRGGGRPAPAHPLRPEDTRAGDRPGPARVLRDRGRHLRGAHVGLRPGCHGVASRGWWHGMSHARTVLVVDDEAAILHLVRMVLEDEGYEVAAARDGREAWALLTEGGLEPDLVVTDLMMPHMDGWEFCRRMQADERLRSIPVVLMSAIAHPSRKDCNFSAALGKPFEVDALVRVVEQAIAA